MNTMKVAGLLCGAGLLVTAIVQAQERVQVQQRQVVPRESQERVQPTPQPRPGVVIEGEADAQLVPRPDVDVQADAQGPEFYRASEIIGMTVNGADNQPLGQVKDLLIDGRTEQIRYLILDGGESLQVEAGQFLVVPWIMAEPHFVADAPDQRFIMVDIDRQRLLQAPMLTTAQFRTLPDAAMFARVDAFFEVDSIRERRTLRPGADDAQPGRRPGPRRTAPGDRPGADADDSAEPGTTRPAPGSRTQPGRRPGAAQPGADQPGADRPGSSRPRTQPGSTDRPRTQPNQPAQPNRPAQPNEPAQPNQPSQPNEGGSTQPGSSGNQGGNGENP